MGGREKAGKGFLKKRMPRLSQEGEEVSQVKKRDHKEDKALADKTGKSVRAFICHIRELGLYSLSNSFRLYARKSSGQICTVDSSLW